MTGDAAVPLSGEAFTVVAILFVLAMLGVVFWRAAAKSRAARGARRRNSDGDGSTQVADGGSKKTDPDASDGSDGGGDGGGGGD